MSYASDVKKELYNLELEPTLLKYQLSAIIVFKGELVLSNKKFNLVFNTTSLSLSRHLVSTFKSIYGISPNIVSKKQNKLDYKDVYQISIDDCDSILNDLRLLEHNYYYNLTDYVPSFTNQDQKVNYLRGAFIAHGSINNPNTNNYHLEIVCPSIVQVKVLQTILDDIDISSSMVERSKGYVLYVKRAENIGDFLRYVGATNMLFAYEDIRIKKDLNNYVNRITNCDVANEQKALATAQKQLDNIEIILNNIPLEEIDDRLLGVINLRNNNPDDSLNELSLKSEDEIGYYISKSGINHRFKEIEILADKILKGGK